MSFDTFSVEKIANGGFIAIIGILVVFIVIALIWAILLCFNLIFNKAGAKKRKTKSVTHDILPTVEETQSTNDEEIVAVIAAAIAMAESEAPQSTFKVVSFKRV